MNNLVNILLEIIIICMGLWLAFFHKSLGANAVNQNKKISELLHIKIKYTERDIRMTQIGYLVGGIIFVTTGILTMLDILKVRP